MSKTYNLSLNPDRQQKLPLRSALGSKMHVRIATFDVNPMQLEAVAEHFRVGAIRAFTACEGFLGYQGFLDQGRGRMVGISRWRSLAALEASSESGRGIIEGAFALGAVMVGEPQILELAFEVDRVRDEPNLSLNTESHQDFATSRQVL